MWFGLCCIVSYRMVFYYVGDVLVLYCAGVVLCCFYFV